MQTWHEKFSYDCPNWAVALLYMKSNLNDKIRQAASKYYLPETFHTFYSFQVFSVRYILIMIANKYILFLSHLVVIFTENLLIIPSIIKTIYQFTTITARFLGFLLKTLNMVCFLLWLVSCYLVIFFTHKLSHQDEVSTI